MGGVKVAKLQVEVEVQQEASEHDVPEVKVVQRSLVIAHVDEEAEQVHGRQRAATEHLKQRRQAGTWGLHGGDGGGQSMEVEVR